MTEKKGKLALAPFDVAFRGNHFKTSPSRPERRDLLLLLKLKYNYINRSLASVVIDLDLRGAAGIALRDTIVCVTVLLSKP
jgi:hypothetical protein